MSDRDRIVAALKTYGLVDRFGDDCDERELLDIADHLIAAGATMPAPPAERCGKPVHMAFQTWACRRPVGHAREGGCF